MRVATPAALIAIQLSVPGAAPAQRLEWPTPRYAPRELAARLNSLDPATTGSVPVARDALVEGLGIWLPDEAEDAFRAFVEFYAREDEVFVYDAAIVISWQRLGERLARWEAFRVGHPELPETKGVVGPEIERLREFYLCGVGGTKVYTPDYGPGPRSIDPQVLASYHRFVFQNPRSDTTPIVHGVLERLGQTKGVMEDELRTYIRQVLKNARTACER